MSKHRLLTLTLTLALLLTALPAVRPAHAAPLEITFWHGLSGNNQKQTEALVDKFNTSQSDIKVVVSAKGNYS
jgi:sn-glycerol 3-phosphate transport system substrate-binding protein